MNMKKLIIVCEEKSRKYGDYLSQLISMEDDTKEGIVGVKDGAVAAQVWTEKEYVKQAQQVASNQYILFIGNSKMIKEKSSHMKDEFAKYGMKYSWLGKQAVLCVENVVSKEEYEEFIEYAKKYHEDIINHLSCKKIKFEEKMTIKDAVKTIVPIVTIGAVTYGGLNVIEKAKLRKKIKDQQYSCCVMKFYLDDLSEFLGI